MALYVAQMLRTILMARASIPLLDAKYVERITWEILLWPFTGMFVIKIWNFISLLRNNKVLR